jgi:hypothetical protein
MAEMNASFQERTHSECWCRQSIDPFRLIHHGPVRTIWPDTGEARRLEKLESRAPV